MKSIEIKMMTPEIGVTGWDMAKAREVLSTEFDYAIEFDGGIMLLYRV